MKPLLRAVAFLPQLQHEIAVDFGNTTFPGLANQEIRKSGNQEIRGQFT
jgi:hypothetical protein